MQKLLDGLPKIIESAHGTGGRWTHELIESVFLPYFRSQPLQSLADQAVVPESGTGRMAISTDSFVVTPYRFPGGNIGDLAVNGTVNDLLMGGATPAYLTVAFVLMEGLRVDHLVEIVQSIANAAAASAVSIIAGDTKVVCGKAEDGLFITTTGVGFLPGGVNWGPEFIQPGDKIILSGTVADHGASVLTKRYNLAFDTVIRSDTASLLPAVMAVRDLCGIRCMRDPTRGGLATTLAELSQTSGLTLEAKELCIPIRDDVRGLCEVLGLDPLYVANEGKLIAVVAPDVASTVLSRLQATEVARDAAIIGTVTKSAPGYALLETAIGAKRVLELLSMEQLPRIC